MIIDHENLMSVDQVITGTAASETVIDFGDNRDVGAGEPLALFIHASEAFAGTGSLTVVLETSADGSFADTVELVSSAPYVEAELGLGAKLLPIRLPRGVQRHLRLNYVVTGDDFTAGKLKAGLVRDLQDQATYPSGFINLA